MIKKMLTVIILHAGNAALKHTNGWNDNKPKARPTSNCTGGFIIIAFIIIVFNIIIIVINIIIIVFIIIIVSTLPSP